MAVSTRIKTFLNSTLRPLNVRVDSWTRLDAEAARVAALEAAGHLTRPRYPLTGGMRRLDVSALAEAWETHKDAIERLKNPATNRTGYTAGNNYYTTPDLEVLYLMVRTLKPRRVVEIGCGNSTRIVRQAILDGDLATELVAIDPLPRADISGLTDRFEECRLEEIDNFIERYPLGADDILFVDSSHEVFVGNDVANIFCRIIPALPRGVVVHVHDVFLPYDYPPCFARDYSHWGEQYLLHALILGRDCDVLWPGHHLQRDRIDLHDRLPFITSGNAQSFWFRWR